MLLARKIQLPVSPSGQSLCEVIVGGPFSATFLDLVRYLFFLPVATSKLPCIPHRSPVLLFFVHTILLVQILY